MKLNLDVRSSGVLLHLSSLPGPQLIGDLGPEACAFVDFLAAAGQRWWQMLPVNPIGPGFSPYSTISSFAGEPLFISLTHLERQGWLKKSETKPQSTGGTKSVNYAKATRHRLPLLKLAVSRAAPHLRKDGSFLKFRRQNQFWLEDYLLFRVIAAARRTPDWHLWPKELRDRDPKALNQIAAGHAEEMLHYAIEQYWFANQWDNLKSYAGSQGIGLIGDLPIFVAHPSADVWSHRKFFRLKSDMSPAVVAGCPPDAFNRDGQLWGNALYDWNALQKDGFSWWLNRLSSAMNLFDAVRLDHFIGFYRYWEIKAGAKNARGGKWIRVPGDAFFTSVTKKLGRPQFIAEDLGAVTPEIRALRDKFGFPGMKVSQFAFDGTTEAEHHKPHALPKTSVAYTGTHDNNTTKGWLQDLMKRARTRGAAGKEAQEELDRIRHYLATDPERVSWDLIRSTMASAANVTVFPMQDLLAQGSGERMNIPGVAKGNWQYRVEQKLLTNTLAEKLKKTTAAYSR
jgi:4-alpha-glucanotransferase